MKGHTYRVIHFKISPNKYLGASIPSRESHIHTQGHTDGVALGFRMYIQMETRIQALFIWNKKINIDYRWTKCEQWIQASSTEILSVSAENVCMVIYSEPRGNVNIGHVPSEKEWRGRETFNSIAWTQVVLKNPLSIYVRADTPATPTCGIHPASNKTQLHKGTVVASIYSVWATSIIFAHTSIIFTNMSRHRSEAYVQQFDTFWNCVSYLSRVCVN